MPQRGGPRIVKVECQTRYHILRLRFLKLAAHAKAALRKKASYSSSPSIRHAFLPTQETKLRLTLAHQSHSVFTVNVEKVIEVLRHLPFYHYAERFTESVPYGLI